METGMSCIFLPQNSIDRVQVAAKNALLADLPLGGTACLVSHLWVTRCLLADAMGVDAATDTARLQVVSEGARLLGVRVGDQLHLHMHARAFQMRRGVSSMLLVSCPCGRRPSWRLFRLLGCHIAGARRTYGERLGGRVRRRCRKSALRGIQAHRRSQRG